MATNTTSSNTGLLEDLLGPDERGRSDSGGPKYLKRPVSRKPWQKNPYTVLGEVQRRRGGWGCSYGLGSLVSFLVVVPLCMFAMGAIIDKVIYGKSVGYDAVTLVAIAYILAPFWLVFGNWPRHARIPDAAASSRLAYDILVHLSFMVCLTVYVNSMATTQRDSFYFNQKIKAVWGLNDIKSTVTSIDDVWTYLNTTAPAAMHPSPGDKCYGGFFSVVVPNYDLPPSDPRSTVGCPLFGTPTGIASLASTGVGPQLRQIRVQPTTNNPFKNVVTNNGTTPPPNFMFYPSVLDGTVSTAPYGPFLKELPTSATRDHTSFGDYLLSSLATTQCSMDCVIAANFSNLGCLTFPPPLYNSSTIAFMRAFLYNDGRYSAVAQGGSMVTPVAEQASDHSYSLPVGGYVFLPPSGSWLLHDPQADWKTYMTTLREAGWIDRATRAIVLSQTFVSVDTQKWQHLTIIFEIPASGYVLSSYNLRVGQFSPQTSDFSQSHSPDVSTWNLAYAVVAFAFFFVGTFVMRVLEARSLVRVFQTSMLELDILLYLLVLTAWVTRLSSLYYWPEYIPPSAGVNGSCNRFIGNNSQELASTTYFWVLSRDVVGAVVIVAWLRLVWFLTLLPMVGQIPRAVIRAIGQIGLFLVTLVLIVWAFTAGFTVIYSADVPEFSTPLQSLQTLWGSMLGNIDVADFIESDFTVGLPLYIIFTFLMLFVFLTFMVSVIDSSFEKVKEADDEITKDLDKEHAAMVEESESSGRVPGSETTIGGHEVPLWAWKWWNLMVRQYELRYLESLGAQNSSSGDIIEPALRSESQSSRGGRREMTQVENPVFAGL